MATNNARLDLAKWLMAVASVAEVVRAHGSMPSGHLYALVMGAGISFGTFSTIQAFLVDSDIVQVQGHMLTWRDGADKRLAALNAMMADLEKPQPSTPAVEFEA